MKRVDMFFWQTGYELDIADNLIKRDVSDDKKQSLLAEAISLGICQEGMSFQEASDEIKRKNRR